MSSPVAARPFSWFVEAIYRSATKAVALGDTGRFSAQVSHHYCHRCVTLISLRHVGDETFLKVKFYLEGFPEPQTAFFDLKRSSHLERLTWSAT